MLNEDHFTEIAQDKFRFHTACHFGLNTLKTVIWTNIPNHYQDSFYKALRAVGVDLKVCYYERIPEERLRMGWNQFKVLPSGEQYVSKSLAFPDLIHDWRERIHVIPGYGDLFIRSLAIHLSQNGVCWIHWSEPSHLGMRWWLTYPIKKWYANLVNRYALGAFGNGIRALQDFRRWGMRQDRLALLPYSAAAGNRSVSPDNMCRDFCSGRSAFLFLGSLCQRKGIDILLTAFSQISRSNPDWVLILAGDDRSNGKYLRLAETMGLTDRILFRGPVSGTCGSCDSQTSSSIGAAQPLRWLGCGSE